MLALRSHLPVVSAEIARTVQQAAQAAQAVSANIGGVTRAAEATQTAARHVLNAASDLAHQPETLSGEVRLFLAEVLAA
jgi:methyl-accepting chemotaxis protein